jgi:hypothetical protein
MKKETLVDWFAMTTEVQAHSSGIIEVGTVKIFIGDQEWDFDIEEHAIKGNYQFKVFLARWQDSSKLDLELDDARVIDQRFIDFIHSEYQRLSQK